MRASQREAGTAAHEQGTFRIDHRAPANILQRFSKSEHEEIGKEAFRQALPQLQASSGSTAPGINTALLSGLRDFRFQTANRRTLTYGQMVAIADEIASFELLEERERERAGQGVRIPLLSPIWDRIGDETHYLDLAARNRAHFHPHNFLSWQPWHWQALRGMHRAWELSEQANGLKREVRSLLARFDQHYQRGRRAIEALDRLPSVGSETPRAVELDRRIDQALAEMQPLLQQAQEKQQQYKTLRTQANDLAIRSMAMNGFGDHFLTDAFAAGHIVTPRRELLDEYSTRLLGFIPVGGVLHCANIPSLAWHDLDNRFGVWVDNSLGKKWLTYGDDFAHEDAPKGRSRGPTLEHVIAATATSIDQMWGAAGGRMPADLLPVLNQIPRPKLDEYPRWTPSDWDRQLRFAAGEQVGATYEAVGSSPSATSRQPPETVPNPRGHAVGASILSARATCLNLMSEFGYENFVVPMVARARRDYAERFFTGRASQIVSPDERPVPQASVVGHVALGSLVGLVAGAGIGFLAGGLLGGIIGGVVGLLGGGLVGGLLGRRRDEAGAGGASAVER